MNLCAATLIRYGSEAAQPDRLTNRGHQLAFVADAQLPGTPALTQQFI